MLRNADNSNLGVETSKTKIATDKGYRIVDSGNNTTVELSGNGTGCNNDLALEEMPSYSPLCSVYPSIGDGKVHIPHADMLTKLEVFSLDGKCLYSNRQVAEALDLSYLPSSIYTLLLKDKHNQSTTQRISISH